MPERGDFETRRQLVQMQMLYEVGLALSESLDPTRVAQEILQRALSMADARAGALLVPSGGSEAPQVVAEVGLADRAGAVDRLPGIGQAWATGQAVAVDAGLEVGRHLLIVPLCFRQQVRGLLLVFDKETRGGGVTRFEEADRALLGSFALQAGAALHNAHLHRDLEQAYAELQAAQAKIAQLQQLRALGDLAAELSHALRHVLGLVVGHADAFLTLKGDPVKAMEAVLAAAEGGQSLIDRIHRVTRLGVGAAREESDLNALVERAVADARALMAQRGGQALEWDQDLDRQLPRSYLNATDVQEAILNLLLNAAEAMPAGGRVTVATGRAGERLRVAVTDTGPGMPEEVKARIFEPFFTTKEEFGSGLGLSIVYRIVTDHGGEVQVETAAGQGTTVRLLLPVVDRPPPAPGNGDASEDPGA